MNRLLTFLVPCPTVKLAMEPKVLAALLEKGALHAADFRCLDLSSKRIVWQMLLGLVQARVRAFAETHSP